jgi:hypothetical protein
MRRQATPQSWPQPPQRPPASRAPQLQGRRRWGYSHWPLGTGLPRLRRRQRALQLANAPTQARDLRNEPKLGTTLQVLPWLVYADWLIGPRSGRNHAIVVNPLRWVRDAAARHHPDHCGVRAPPSHLPHQPLRGSQPLLDSRQSVGQSHI